MSWARLLTRMRHNSPMPAVIREAGAFTRDAGWDDPPELRCICGRAMFSWGSTDLRLWTPERRFRDWTPTIRRCPQHGEVLLDGDGWP